MVSVVAEVFETLTRLLDEFLESQVLVELPTGIVEILVEYDDGADG
jgi:hypothetical protein